MQPSRLAQGDRITYCVLLILSQTIRYRITSGSRDERMVAAAFLPSGNASAWIFLTDGAPGFAAPWSWIKSEKLRFRGQCQYVSQPKY